MVPGFWNRLPRHGGLGAIGRVGIFASALVLAPAACRDRSDTIRVERMTRESAREAAAQDFVLEPLRGTSAVIYSPPPDLSQPRITVPAPDTVVQRQEPSRQAETARP